jgi:ABC-type transport system involved in cytochrome c biogenesis permease subunit
MKTLLVVLSLVGSLAMAADAPPLTAPPPESPKPRLGFQWEPMRLMAIQDRGRIKPLETFANESMLFITGKREWNGMAPIEVVFGWLIAFDREWEEEAFIRVDHEGLKRAIGLDTTKKYFSPATLQANAELPKIVREAVQKEQRKERPSDIEKKAIQLQNQRGLLEGIVTGQSFTILPNPEGLTRPWFSLTSLTDQANAPYNPEDMQKLANTVRELLDGFVAANSGSWNKAVAELVPLVRKDLSRGSYPELETLQRESHYNNLRPFRWAWILYTAAFIALLFFIVTGNAVARWAGAATLLGAFGMHIYGFTIRCMISGRPPVTNMYESVIWVTWGCILFSLIIWAAYKNAVIPTAASAFAIAGLILADNLPLVLDPGIHPLEPVLRSNYWLTIHVLTITLSYAAFALSLCLGNVVLGNYLWRPSQTGTIQQYSLYMYRAMQIGVVLLAAGTILGGVWADYSWGRFWGWDPKEVWALIALLLYLAVLHGRFTGWLRGFGFAAVTVMSFLGVLMAWYGVNFVLGVGLHSYGFGSGGMGYVASYVAAQLAFIGAAYVRYKEAAKAMGRLDTGIFPKSAV